jgi:hypothetical protein
MKNFSSLLRSCVAAMAVIAASLSLFSCQKAASLTLEACVEQANAECPMYIEEGMICDRIYISGNNVIYNYQTTYDVVEGVRMLGDMAKDFIFDELQSTAAIDSDLRTLIDLCIEAHYNIVYRYCDNMNNVGCITINYSELATM